ncbi:cobyric acid synthase [Thalassotalea psychrophila]|uniref:Cobyric acid synthase n=1 Tax=Thalassotalea psychrophila TaxID=3065647 RepID=A0ABY9TZL3_9GAMM|nr:cobyric acid synthase [Colwelliaceae bacterium SQ149]
MTKQSKTLMIQGTTSDAGKSTLVAAICRVLARKSIKVAPFKPQNMALNSAVTKDGGEIGRAQAVQAHAANIEPEVDFNPILLKPNSDTGAQVIVHGKALSMMEAQSYHDYKKVAMQAVLESHQRLQQRFDYIVVEGAGSPAEINLREGDIANMGFAERVNCPVILIADIDRGGVFAHLVGTLELLSKSEQQRVIGFVINRFRGDIKLLESGLEWLEQKTGKPVLGVLPYLHGLSIASEDAVDPSQVTDNEQIKKLKVVVPVYPRMSNHTDFDALRWHPEIDLQFIYPKDISNLDDLSTQPAQPLPSCDLIILPGSKNVQADLAFLKSLGWHHCIKKHLRYGGKVIGICGGMQMLGDEIFDPNNVESEHLSSSGLGLLPFTTTLTADKTLTNVLTKLTLLDQTSNIEGYEIHAGISTQLSNDMTAIFSHSTSLGFESHDQQIIATYLHGLFENPDALSLLMKWAGASIAKSQSFKEQQNYALNTLADSVEQHLNMPLINKLTTQWNSHE